MKKMICEICDATNFIKQNGVFECRSCGTKYSVEEAKKITKAVNVNMSNLLEKDAESYYILAELSYYGPGDKSRTELYCNKALEIDPNNYKAFFLLAKTYYDFGKKSKAELYCDKVLEIDPNNYEACFFKGKIVASHSQITKTNLKEIINCFIKAITTAPNDVCEELKIDVKSVIEPLLKKFLVDSCEHFSKFPNEKSVKELQERVQTVAYVMKLCSEVGVSTDLCSSHEIAFTLTYDAFVPALANIYKEFYSLQYPNDKNFFDFINKCGACLCILETAVNIEEDNLEANITRYKLMIDIHEKCIAAKSYEYSSDLGKYYLSKRLTQKAISSRIDIIMKCHEEIKKIDSNYEIPERPDITMLRGENNNNVYNTASGGCYVATAVYGSYDCPQVWTLRRFRDYTLAETWYGRAFIHIYYTISPKLVKYFGKQKWFKNICKKTLDYMVENLKIKGVKDTPYEDWRW